MTKLRSALWLPTFDELADPAIIARLAAEAEEAGWHGVFVWDNLRWQAPVRQVADPWITLAAIQALTPPSFGVELSPIDARDPSEIEHAMAAFAREPNGGLIVTGSQSAAKLRVENRHDIHTRRIHRARASTRAARYAWLAW